MRSARTQFVVALGLSCLSSLALFAYDSLYKNSAGYDYLPWNLFLAWIPLLLAVRLHIVVKRKPWSSWEALFLSTAWLLFLPNSFYMISDFIHLQEVARADILFYVVLFTSFIVNGVVLGFTSLLIIHRLLIAKKFRVREVAGILGAVLFLCSAAIYIGRDLRWNSWDIITNPGGLLFDISDRLSNLAAYPQMAVTILSFFVLLSTMYFLLWRSFHLVRQLKTVWPLIYWAYATDSPSAD